MTEKFIVFCDDSKCKTMPTRTPEQEKRWEKEQDIIVEKYVKSFPFTDGTERSAIAV